MPYGLLFIYKNFMNLGDDEGSFVFYVYQRIAMFIDGTVSIAEEKEKNNLKTLLLSGGCGHTNILSRFYYISRNYYFKIRFVSVCRRRYF